ncbi:hypothetical protein BDN72DRAFT_822925 [Pluteus cervinus]|uniref:Uncharacterized protein n=1 Tax=Pluteus cervinus TaxID=181527 RepID=A0ACD3AMJ2_9AGAR|nr:hypothetical protein BDN72DRAFT_822925 [Pluteus cervinus]
MFSYCRGCCNTFVSSHFRDHLRKSSHPECQAILVELNNAIFNAPLPTAPNHATSASSSQTATSTTPPPDGGEPSDGPISPIPVEVSGDLFGSYMDIDDTENIGRDGTGDNAQPDLRHDIEADSDDEDLEQAADEAELEISSEPEHAGRPPQPPGASTSFQPDHDAADIPSLADSEAPIPPQTPPSDRFPSYPSVVLQYQNPAAAVHSTKMHDQRRYQGSLSDSDSRYAPFSSRMEWDIARCAKSQPAGSAVFSELLAIPGVVDALGLSFRSMAELNDIIDKSLPGRPAFQREEIEIGGEIFEVYFRDVMACVEALYSDPVFAPYLLLAPERHFMDESMENRAYYEVNTGEWWWSTQVQLDSDVGPGRTIIPLIFSSDKTQLTLFGDTTVYPLYMTLGNIAKEIRHCPSLRAYVLIGYLPTSKLAHIKTKASRRRCVANLYHACLGKILKPTIKPGRRGKVMPSGDGVRRRCHPIHAIFSGDYPEQLLATGVPKDKCAQCPAGKAGFCSHQPVEQPFRELGPILEALHTVDDDAGSNYREVCKTYGVKPIIDPFWKDLPYANIYQSITPDVLHQLHQGLVKHIVKWLIEAFGPAELDARCRRLPPNHHIRLFMQGISPLSRVTGREHGQMCQFLLGLVIDIPHPQFRATFRIVATLRALLDFIQLAQFPFHTTKTLKALGDALQRFHEHKQHYVRSIKLFGTTDNYNTQFTERLHIDSAKIAYRASNRKEALMQMTKWLERQEKMTRHEKYIAWRIQGCPLPKRIKWPPMSFVHSPQMKLAKYPSVWAVSLDDLESVYGAKLFFASLARYVIPQNNPNITRRDLEKEINYFKLPSMRFPIWHRIKFIQHKPLMNEDQTVDTIHVRPPRADKRGRPVPARFDTVIVRIREDNDGSIYSYRVAQVRAVFSLTPAMIAQSLRKAHKQGITCPSHLAYVEWFSPFPRQPDASHRMYKITRSYAADGIRLVSTIPVSDILCSVHLLPKFGADAPREWLSSNVLEKCDQFFVNPFTSSHVFRLLM